MAMHVYETIEKFTKEKGIHLSSFGWSNVKAIHREAQGGKLSNLQIIERLKREENLRLGFNDNDWRQIGKQLER